MNRAFNHEFNASTYSYVSGTNMRLALMLIMSLSMVEASTACEFKANVAQIMEGQQFIQWKQREVSNLGRKADRIFVGSVEQWTDVLAKFRDISSLKGQTAEHFEIQWKDLLASKQQREREAEEVLCDPRDLLEGQVPAKPVDPETTKASYLVYMIGGKLLRAVPLDSSAHQEIECLLRAGRIKLSQR